MSTELATLLVIVIVIIILYSRSEQLSSDISPDLIPTDANNYIRLYETFTYKPNPPDARWWEFATDQPAGLRKQLKMFLKSYDIKVTQGKVQIWALYPDDILASSLATSVSGYSDDYTDAMPLLLPEDPKTLVGYNGDTPEYIKEPGWQHVDTINSFAANESKYRKIAEVGSGEHVQGTLDFVAKRIIVLARFY